MNKPNVITNNPNASVAGGTGGLATVAVLLAQQFGLDLDPALAAALAALLPTIVLALGKKKPVKG